MSDKKPLLVGFFVLGALMLAVAAILLIGGTQLFSRTAHVVSVFEGSVYGLAVGSPVTFRGVTIGKVQAIQVQVNVTDHTGVIPVYMELEPDKINWSHGVYRQDAQSMADAVAAGLRAQLRSESLVTGQLSVDLDFYPGSPVVMSHLASHEFEIPTMPSDMQNLKDEIRDLNLRDLADKTRLALTSMQHVLDTANEQIGPVANSLRDTLKTTQLTLNTVQADAARTLRHIDDLAVEGHSQLVTNGRDLDQLLRTSQAAAAQADKLVTTLNDMTAPRSPLRDDLQASVRDLAASADSLRTFTRELERAPAATLFKKAR